MGENNIFETIHAGENFLHIYLVTQYQVNTCDNVAYDWLPKYCFWSLIELISQSYKCFFLSELP